jgi:Na+/proline symporter
LTIILISQSLQLNFTGFIETIKTSPQSQVFFFDDISKAEYFWKQFFSGAFIAIVMTGLDQDMMQKNLTCKTLKDAQKNMFWFTIVLVIVNILFLSLGVLLSKYAVLHGIDAHGDQLFPTIATASNLGMYAAVLFILGLIAAAYSSADSALTALTTSFCIDILNIEKYKEAAKQIAVRKAVHIAFSILLIATIIIFKYLINDPSVISSIFKFAGYTYGPLLGLYALGLFTKVQLNDKWVPIIAILSPLLSIFLNNALLSWFQFDLGFFILIINGLITFLGLLIIKSKKQKN